MASLATELLTSYEKEVVAARDVAEAAAQAALNRLAVAEPRPFDTMDERQRQLRRALRAQGRQLGGGGLQEGMLRLVEEIAYEHWHRMLFTRFLAENHLLLHPEGVPVSLQECAELAPEEDAEDQWELATRYAVAMLPGIFLLDDPAMQVRFAPEGRHRLEQIVTDLPSVIFTADDSLGWAYQFWQSKKKDEVNRSERKIGGADIAPVTQLFTEDYMVKFLLHNSLGAWWAARHPNSPLLESFDYLRFRDDGAPAAGTFDGWPARAAEVTVMDPCCGSGHFIVAAFEMLSRMRMEEEGLGVAEAGDAVIRDNLFGLEIDPRCTQIAAFNLALAAWKAGGYRELPLPNIACSGIPVQGQLEDWVKLAGDDEALQRTMERLYHLFRNAPDLGSLINPTHIPIEERMFVADYRLVEPLLVGTLEQEKSAQGDPTAALFGQSVTGIAKAAGFLAARYVLIATNVPYLGSGSHDSILKGHCEAHYPEAAADLATVFLQRCREFSDSDSTYSVVTPQNWLFLVSYEDQRIRMLKEQRWDLLAWIGEKGFTSKAAAGAYTALLILTNTKPAEAHGFAQIDVSAEPTPEAKGEALRNLPHEELSQREQLNHPGGRISAKKLAEGPLLSKYASSSQGIKTGDDFRFRRCFWEVLVPDTRWRFYQSSVTETRSYGGMEHVLEWVNRGKHLARLQGLGAWGKPGLAVTLSRELRCAIYMGGAFASNMSALTASDPNILGALWAFGSSGELNDAVRATYRKTIVSDASLVEVPFDLEYWSVIAEQRGGIPQPYSNEPTQWLFNGHPYGSTDPLQVAAARLLGYRWPENTEDDLDRLADEDGIVCVSAVAGDQPAAERLRSLLAHAYTHPPELPDFERYRVGDFVPTTPVDPYGGWSPAVQVSLLAHVGYEGKSLNDWLRDGFFQQHCKLFKNRPFIWHIWDGRTDGFSALVNYHKLDHARLERLIYTYLGDWVRTQRAEVERGVSGAEGRFVAALELKGKLEAILEGERPYDIYVRWKPLHEQPIEWNPDLNDGVRLNIRPFVKAGVLRRKFNVHWRKDRGKNPDGSERHNDLHFTRADKEAARKAARRQ